jgi:hypothetical protein
MVSSNEPISFTEAERSPSWRKAIMEEMDFIEENGTWSLIDLPPGHKSIGVKWVFKVKRDEHGVVFKHKAGLMVKGYVQQHGINYDKVFTHGSARLTVLAHHPHNTRGVGKCTIWTSNRRS